MLTASALLGINAKPFTFYYPRPPWIEELAWFADPSDDNVFHRSGPYGWPVPAYPSWSWCGNGVPLGAYPQWDNFWNPGDAHIACNWPQWNTRALVVDVVANLIVFVLMMGLWSVLISVLRRYRQNGARAAQRLDAVRIVDADRGGADGVGAAGS